MMTIEIVGNNKSMIADIICNDFNSHIVEENDKSIAIECTDKMEKQLCINENGLQEYCDQITNHSNVVITPDNFVF